jgi:hypothetical protein
MNILVKKTILLLCATMLVLSPICVFGKEYPVRAGEFEDGAKVLYQCESKASVKMVFVTKEGQAYKAVLFCGDEV